MRRKACSEELQRVPDAPIALSGDAIGCLCWEGKIAVKRGELAGIRTQDPRLKRALLYQLSYELAIRPLFSNYHKVTGPHCSLRSRDLGQGIDGLDFLHPSLQLAANRNKGSFTPHVKSFSIW
jgi:hypothetical protein